MQVNTLVDLDCLDLAAILRQQAVAQAELERLDSYYDVNLRQWDPLRECSQEQVQTIEKLGEEFSKL